VTPRALTLAVVALALAGCGASTSTSSGAATPSRTASATPSLASDIEGRLVYAWDRPTDDVAVIGTANVDGGDERELLAGAELPRWSPDGTKLSVVAEGSQGLVFVGVINPDGTGYVQFDSPDPTLNLGCSAWSPDGERFACEGWDDADATRNGIYTVRASDGGDLTRITSVPDGTHDVPGDYSPDGTQIVFVRSDLSDEEHATLMAVNVDVKSERQLTDQKVGLRCYWSPDGSSVLTEADGTLLVVPADGGDPSPIDLGVTDAWATRASWSPDGEHIVFSMRIDLSAPETTWDIYTADVDGSNVVQVTDTPDLGESDATWSP
jgi:Tol biopolymer transport system component